MPRLPNYRPAGPVLKANPAPDSLAAAQVAEPEETGAEEMPDDIAGELARLGAALAAVGGKKQAQGKVLRELETLLTKLSPKDYPDLADNPAIQRFLDLIGQQRAVGTKDPPGTLYNQGSLAQMKKPWTWADLSSDKVPWVRFVPTETIAVTYQGLKVQLIADVEFYGPDIFHKIYLEHRQSLRTAHQHAGFLFHQGPAPNDLTVLNDGSRHVRAMATAGRFLPGAGGFDPGQADESEGGKSE